MISSPENEIPGCPMPESGYDKNETQVEIQPPSCLDTVAAKGNVQIILEPVPQCNVPPSPKFRDALGYIWIIEVLRKFKTDHTAYANGHI